MVPICFSIKIPLANKLVIITNLLLMVRRLAMTRLPNNQLAAAPLTLPLLPEGNYATIRILSDFVANTLQAIYCLRFTHVIMIYS